MLTCRACGIDLLTWQRMLTELPRCDEAVDIVDLLASLPKNSAPAQLDIATDVSAVQCRFRQCVSKVALEFFQRASGEDEKLGGFLGAQKARRSGANRVALEGPP